MDSLVIGRVVGVYGFRIKVELDPFLKSSSRAGLEGVQTAIAINSYVSFDIGAGEIALGVITDLEAKESYDPAEDGELTLELVKPRRIAMAQLLGTVKPVGKGCFDPGIMVLPTLDTPVKTATAKLLNVVFHDAPKRNKPDGYEGDEHDCALDIGNPTVSSKNKVQASFNDLFSRPLAIVGNTGSGKSYTVASLISRAINKVTDIGRSRVFILDINGEYGRAFGIKEIANKKPDNIYLNGEEFSIPIWLMNAKEVCEWLSASEQTQEPVLKDYWSLAKGLKLQEGVKPPDYMAEAFIRLDALILALRPSQQPMNQKVQEIWNTFCSYTPNLQSQEKTNIQTIINEQPRPTNQASQFATVTRQPEIIANTEKLKVTIEAQINQSTDVSQQSADKPLAFPISLLKSPKVLLDAIKGQEDENRLRQNIITLQLRLTNRLTDKRWSCFYNYADLNIASFVDWLKKFGLNDNNGRAINVIDCSMLGHEVLPYVCGIIGRILLELRERVNAESRYKEPWVVVLEEAHNYARPARQDEEKGNKISREAYERIAKEGRKFGLSLVVASQRPSEISPTIISQCANFIMHRLQNPNDIEHFRSIIPAQSRRLIEQITVLASGEAIVFGSAFHIPTRVMMHCPEKTPWSQTAAPYYEWSPAVSKGINLDEILKNWGIDNDNVIPQAQQTPVAQVATTQSGNVLDDEIPF